MSTLINMIFNPTMFKWTWRYVFTPLLVGIFFGLGHFFAYWLCETNKVKHFENKLMSYIN